MPWRLRRTNIQTTHPYAHLCLKLPSDNYISPSEKVVDARDKKHADDLVGALDATASIGHNMDTSPVANDKAIVGR